MEMTPLLIVGLAVSVATNIGMATVFFTRRSRRGQANPTHYAYRTGRGLEGRAPQLVQGDLG
ncbi:MAG: hypothetical protein KFB96_20895 [Thiocapsa sp.]|uniref:hypothetical protein n=1 Tax=Thiocapsa sp. TaxID=2024551 RepID=UPI001BCB3E49|nr:hypothetical protein [Thiocapsa sp.]QVL48076.1 MAG: hypothetical protein KFB96_20895 [Thiocapsa sp.]